jgi:cytochrome b subunit of formate dehydrogenase
MTKNAVKKILTFAMFLCFIIIALTGILKFRELLRPLNIPYDQLPMKQISLFHDWIGIIFIFLIIIHLIFQKLWFKKR